MGYLKNKTSCFTKIIEYNNIFFDNKVVEDKNGKEDRREAISDLEEKRSKKKT